MHELADCHDCGHKFYLQGTDLQNIVGGGGCPSCGGHQLYRSQPSGIPSDMDLREDVIDPGEDSKMKGNPLQEGIWGNTDGGWQNRNKRDESFASVKKQAAAIEALPYQQAGVHFGPSSELAHYGVRINGEQFQNPQDIAMRYSPMNPNWDRSPVVLEHEDPNILAGAKAIVESGNHNLMHPYVYNAHKETVQPHPNGLSPDVVMGLGNLDAYVNDARVRNIAKPGVPLDHDGGPIILGAQSPEELQVAKNVVTQGSSNPAREYRMSQQVQSKVAGPMEDMLGLAPQASGNHVLNWTPGMHGRGLFIGPDLHTWNAYDPATVMQTNDTGIHHSEYPASIGINPKHPDIRWDSGVEIEPDGGVDPIAGRDVSEHVAAEPRLHQKHLDWAFSNTKRSYPIEPPMLYEQSDIPEGMTLHDYATTRGKKKCLGCGYPFFARPGSELCPGCETRQLYESQGIPYVSHTRSVNRRSMNDTLNQEVYMPWVVEATVKEADLLGDVGNAVGGAANWAGNAAGNVGNFVKDNAVPIGTGLAAGALIAASPFDFGATAAPGAALAGETAAEIGGTAATDAAVTGAETGAAPTVMNGAMGTAKGWATNAAKKAIKNKITQGLGGGALANKLMGGGGSSGGPGGGSGGGAPFGFDNGLGGVTNESYLPTASVKQADYDSPDSNSSIPGLNDDFNYQDPHEFADGDNTNNQFNPNLDSGVGSQGASRGDNLHPAIQKFHEHLPLLLHYYDSEESGRNDPKVLEVHHALESAYPGYLAHAGRGLHYIEHHHHHAVVAPVPGALCPQCGAVTDAHGHCPQCGYTPPVQQPAQATGITPVAPSPGFQPTSALDQGPQTDEQKAAVAELLEQEGRGREIPNMLTNGYMYAEELSKVQHKLNKPPPNVPEGEQIQPPPPPTMGDPSQAGPVPGMQSPQAPLSSIQAAIKRFSADNIAPACPRCKSHTTGVLNDDGECRCHACGKVFKAPLSVDKVGKTAADNIAPACPKCHSHTTGVLNEDGECRCHSCGNVFKSEVKVDKVGKTAFDHDEHNEHRNVLNAPAAEQQGQRNIEKEQDSSGYWKDSGGNRLIAGQEYEMHSGKYPIPDIIRVESIKPDEITFTIQSQYGLDPRDQVTRQEAQVEQLSFLPYDGNSGDQVPDQSTQDDNSHAEGPGQVTDLSNSPQSQYSHVESSEHCSKCSSTDITSELHSPEIRHFDCYRCGHTWDVNEEDGTTASVLPEETRAWVRGDEDGPIAHIGMEKDMSGMSRNLSDIAHRTAGAKFSPREQKEFVDEKGNARNKDRLNLADTHYESRYKTRSDGLGNASEVNDDYLALGL